MTKKLSTNIYSIPFPTQIKVLAMSDTRVHFGDIEYAIDFIIPLDTPILAAASGVVSEIKIDSNKGGSCLKYADEKYLNYMVVKHKANEFSIYGHLKFNTTKLTVGSHVKKGEFMALSGKSGLMTMPHLHFHVFKKKKDDSIYSINVRFDRKIRIHKPLGQHDKYDKLFTFLEKKRLTDST